MQQTGLYTMRSPTFTLWLALWLVFWAYPVSEAWGRYETTEQPFQLTNWWETTEQPFQLTTWWETTEQPFQLTTWWETISASNTVTPTSPSYGASPNAPDPSVEVYQQVGNSGSLIVVCQFGMKTGSSHFHLSVRNSDGKRMLNDPACIAETMCVFNVTVTPPVSFTCVHVVSAHRDVQTVLSDVFIYTPHNAPEQLKPQVSTSYIVFASFIGVGLVVLVTMLLVSTLKTRRKSSWREVKENVYAPTEII